MCSAAVCGVRLSVPHVKLTCQSPREPTTTVDPWPTILAEANDLVKQTPRAKAKIVQNESLDKITQYLEELTLEKGVMMEAVERRATIANMSALMGSSESIVGHFFFFSDD